MVRTLAWARARNGHPAPIAPNPRINARRFILTPRTDLMGPSHCTAAGERQLSPRPSQWMETASLVEGCGEPANVSVGSLADLASRRGDVRYSPGSGHTMRRRCRFCATTGLMRRSKRALFDHLVGSSEQRGRQLQA